MFPGCRSPWSQWRRCAAGAAGASRQTARTPCETPSSLYPSRAMRSVTAVARVAKGTPRTGFGRGVFRCGLMLRLEERGQTQRFVGIRERAIGPDAGEQAGDAPWLGCPAWMGWDTGMGSRRASRGSHRCWWPMSWAATRLGSRTSASTPSCSITLSQPLASCCSRRPAYWGTARGSVPRRARCRCALPQRGCRTLDLRVLRLEIARQHVLALAKQLVARPRGERLHRETTPRARCRCFAADLSMRSELDIRIAQLEG